LKDQSPTPIDEKPLAATPRMVIPVSLTKGINDFSVTLVGPGGESESSPLVRWVLDKDPPVIKLASPKDGAMVNRKAVTLQGRTQGRSTLNARNMKTGESIGGTAAPDGTFSLSLPIAGGTNPIRLSATDPAGNQRALDLSIRQHSGDVVFAGWPNEDPALDQFKAKGVCRGTIDSEVRPVIIDGALAEDRLAHRRWPDHLEGDTKLLGRFREARTDRTSDGSKPRQQIFLDDDIDGGNARRG